MDVPHVTRTEYQLVRAVLFVAPTGIDQVLQMNIDDGFLNLMTADGAAKDDVKVPEGDIGKQIEADFEEGKELLVTVVSSMGEEAALGVKVCLICALHGSNARSLPHYRKLPGVRRLSSWPLVICSRYSSRYVRFCCCCSRTLRFSSSVLARFCIHPKKARTCCNNGNNCVFCIIHYSALIHDSSRLREHF